MPFPSFRHYAFTLGLGFLGPLCVYPRVGISRSASGTNIRFYLSGMVGRSEGAIKLWVSNIGKKKDNDHLCLQCGSAFVTFLLPEGRAYSRHFVYFYNFFLHSCLSYLSFFHHIYFGDGLL